MNYNQYQIQFKNIQSLFLEYIENEETNSVDFQKLDLTFLENRHYFKSLLYLIARISKSHHRTPNFFTKINHILDTFADEIKQTFSSSTLFNIFKRDKNILLYFIKMQIITINQDIVNLMLARKTFNFKYEYYFYPEIKSFINEHTKKLIENELINEDPNIFTNFEAKRQIGQNDMYICEVIRNDLIDDFIIYVNRTNLSIKSTRIKATLFETNFFLIGRRPTLIEYAAFFGSIQIFKYLLLNNSKLTLSLWQYAIYGKNAEIIHLLEENDVIPIGNYYFECLKTAIKCHHNDIVKYIQNSFIDQNSIDNDNFYYNEILYAFHYHNYEFFPDDIFNNKYIIFYACKYDYFEIVKFLLNDENFDYNITPIRYAVDKANFDIVDFLLSQPNIDIGRCFKNAEKLTKITIPSHIQYIGENAFSECISLQQIIIPPSVKEIKEKAFFGDRKLNEIELPPSITEISKGCFQGCVNLKHISIPSSVTVINDNAFDNCESLSDIIIPSSVIEIKECSFLMCKSLVEISIPAKIIGKYSFYKCRLLKKVVILSTVEVICEGAFEECYQLSNVTFADNSSLKTISKRAFSHCDNLTEISIPSSVKFIDESAFSKRTKVPTSNKCDIF